MNEILIAHNIPDKNGVSKKDRNLLIHHSYKVGEMAQLKDGVRLHIVKLVRDCDGTPLYELSADKNDTEWGVSFNQHNHRQRTWVGPYSADSICVVTPEESEC